VTFSGNEPERLKEGTEERREPRDQAHNEFPGCIWRCIQCDFANNDVLKTPPKKRKVDYFALANPNHTPKPPVLLKFVLVLPDIATLEDCIFFAPGLVRTTLGNPGYVVLSTLSIATAW
jgi:hypothetical protein